MLLRMVSTQPPTEVTRIVKPGKTAWRSTSPMKCQLNLMLSVSEYPNPWGNQCNVTANRSKTSIAKKKYGNAPTITKKGGNRLSKAPLRRHAEPIPISVPAANARTVVTPTRPIVQGRAENTTLDTCSGKKVSDVPKCPVNVSPR